PVIGAHAAGYNTGSTGVAVLGTFTDTAPSQAALDSVADVLAWKFVVHGVNPDPNATTVRNGEVLPTVVGHGDVGSTACPGTLLHNKLASIRQAIQVRAGQYDAQWTSV